MRGGRFDILGGFLRPIFIVLVVLMVIVLILCTILSEPLLF